ncbi:MAG: ATP-dependent helicase [Synergistaceae bacterium]|jgi:DNA helicase-2/ATP-dependent DNA helicase PcrA|nr:ATP-dependent helicase [Synergistaceae bacterium]
MKLSPKQKTIVEHIDGAILVNAGPGSGKTRVLTERVKHLLSVKKRVKVLALTFSNMAAEEMRSRLDTDREVGEAIERVTIGTIHSFCLDVIQSRGYLIGLRPDVSLFENETDRVAILRSIFTDESQLQVILSGKQKPDTFLSTCLSIISEQKRNLISPELCEVEDSFPEIYQKYNDVLRTQNAMDFDDILFFAYRILAENLDVVRLYNSVYRYICIDESQDLNNAQYRVIQALCGTNFRNIMMVGDANQSIYAFNGSSSSYMSQSFVRDFNPTVYTLDENFRSAKQIIQFANNLVGSQEDISKYFYDGKVAISACANEAEEAQNVRVMLETLLANGHKDIENHLKYEDFAIIARNKYVFSQIERVFTERKIPFYYKKTRSGISFETDYMKAFDLILRLIMNPLDLFHRQLLFKLIPSKFPMDTISSDIKQLIEVLLTSQNKFAWLKSALPYLSIDGVLNFDKALGSLKENMPSTSSDDDRYLLEEDINEWHKHWTKFKSHISSENRSLVSFRNAISLGKTQEIDGESGVVLLTAHMSKGLEFEVVFIIGLAEGTFPDYRAVNSGGEALAQEKNNMYVAVTRAKRLCFLSYPKGKRMPWGDDKQQRPSRFISQSLAQLACRR